MSMPPRGPAPAGRNGSRPPAQMRPQDRQAADYRPRRERLREHATAQGSGPGGPERFHEHATQGSGPGGPER